MKNLFVLLAFTFVGANSFAGVTRNGCNVKSVSVTETETVTHVNCYNAGLRLVTANPLLISALFAAKANDIKIGFFGQSIEDNRYKDQSVRVTAIELEN
jgi:hypothetical protein